MNFKDGFRTISMWIAWQIDSNAHQRRIINHNTTIRKKEFIISIHCTFKRTIVEVGMIIVTIMWLMCWYVITSLNAILLEDRVYTLQTTNNLIFQYSVRVRSRTIESKAIVRCIEVVIFLLPIVTNSTSKIVKRIFNNYSYNLFKSAFYGLLSYKSKITFSSFHMHRRIKLKFINELDHLNRFRNAKKINLIFLICPLKVKFEQQLTSTSK